MRVMALFDEAIDWLVARGQVGQWSEAPATRPLSGRGVGGQRRTAEPELVAAGVAVDRLANAVGVRFDLVGAASPRTEMAAMSASRLSTKTVTTEAPSAMGVLHHVDGPMLG